MRKLIWVVTAVAVAFAFALPVTQAEDAKKTHENLMRRKVTESQKVLEGLATGDFEKITSGAEELISISKLAEWKVLKDPQYDLFSNEFRRRADQVAQAGREKNLDAATLGYVEMTMTCVRCHKHVREVRRTELDQPGPSRLAAD